MFFIKEVKDNKCLVIDTDTYVGEWRSCSEAISSSTPILGVSDTGITAMAVSDMVKIQVAKLKLSCGVNIDIAYGNNEVELRCVANLNRTQFTIPYGITSIGANAFYNCGHLKYVSVPSTVVKIKCAAFARCFSLESIVIPSSVSHIATRAFEDCHSLVNIVLPDGITYLGRGTFCRCESLRSINLPSSLTKINKDMFKGCISLTDVHLPDVCTTVGACAFLNCDSLRSITFDGRFIRRIDKMAFAYSSLEEVIITHTINGDISSIDIGSGAFWNCGYFTGVITR